MNVTIWLPSYSVKSCAINDFKRLDVKILDWEQNTIIDAEALEKYVLKIGRIPNNELIISDNILETLIYHENSIVFANFFHHENSNVTCSKAYRKKLNSIIDKNYKKIFVNKFIKYHPKHKLSQFNTVKFLDFYGEDTNLQSDSVLISVGTTNLVSRHELQTLADIVRRNKNTNTRIFLDPRILKYMPNYEGLRIQHADYTREMYAKIHTAFVRPGLSTIQKLLYYNAQINPLLVGVNEEILSTSQIIENEGWGNIYTLQSEINFNLNKGAVNGAHREFFYSRIELEQLINSLFARGFSHVVG